MKTIVALYDQRREAVRAVRELIAHGIPKDRISFVSRAVPTDMGRSHLPLDDAEHPASGITEGHVLAHDVELRPEPSQRIQRSPRTTAPDLDQPEMVGIPGASPGASMGATLGIGSVLLGVAFLSVPAIGPVLMAGPLVTGFAAASAGVTAKDLPTQLSQSGMPPHDAERYAMAVRFGGVLVVLSLDDEYVEDAAIILARHAPVDPERLRLMGTAA